jgi:hypothetical protein
MYTSCRGLSEVFKVLCKKPDDVTRFDGIKQSNPNPDQFEKQDPDRYQSEKQCPDPYQKGVDPQHRQILSIKLKVP